MENYKKERIALEVISVLYENFLFLKKNDIQKYFTFHEAFLKAFSDKLEGKVHDIPTAISLSSWLHGLNTSLGQSFFEKVGQILCDGEKREFRGLKISTFQQTKISDIIAELKNTNREPDLEQENSELFNNKDKADKEISNFTADVYFEDSHSITAIELKTVKPNSSIFKAEKTKILEAKTALKRLYPDKEIKYFIGFPFDPLSDFPTGYDKGRYHSYSVDFKKYVDENEFLLAGELWDFLSDSQNTMHVILDVINSIATTEFMANYEFICGQKENASKHGEKYLELLHKWFLFREKNIVENYPKIEELGARDTKLLRYLNQTPFKNDATYNENRAQRLFAVL
ncbi:MAG: TdeIII family type II restriction endonuclease [Melioribacteraceae bacterium]|nr:TdeIII family type II restriction endonuclease [Melioribacteraceae bacterium]MCF8354569.1 TdeIII family type II restriction endonuclease [Melioribacteraceae bacterium]MCF8394501.1 TdeIII family type II restriction endonuclease [Melioribacteraceae bacterium]MCF8420089.1 TdeIII family type II restriction endonuclease [Melioribacteraceae bacterium]